VDKASALARNKKAGGGAPALIGVVGGEEEDRTPDLRIANATLSQLSYPPNEQKVYNCDCGFAGALETPEIHEQNRKICPLLRTRFLK
jgi:hypothetical protein